MFDCNLKEGKNDIIFHHKIQNLFFIIYQTGMRKKGSNFFHLIKPKTDPHGLLMTPYKMSIRKAGNILIGKDTQFIWLIRWISLNMVHIALWILRIVLRNWKLCMNVKAFKGLEPPSLYLYYLFELEKYEIIFLYF